MAPCRVQHVSSFSDDNYVCEKHYPSLSYRIRVQWKIFHINDINTAFAVVKCWKYNDNTESFSMSMPNFVLYMTASNQGSGFLRLLHIHVASCIHIYIFAHGSKIMFYWNVWLQHLGDVFIIFPWCTFWTHSKDEVLDYFLWNFLHRKTTKPTWLNAIFDSDMA